MADTPNLMAVGWSTSAPADHIRVCKPTVNGRGDLVSIVVHSTGRWRVRVFGRDLPGTSSLFTDHLQTLASYSDVRNLFDAVASMHICCGLHDRQRYGSHAAERDNVWYGQGKDAERSRIARVHLNSFPSCTIASAHEHIPSSPSAAQPAPFAQAHTDWTIRSESCSLLHTTSSTPCDACCHFRKTLDVISKRDTEEAAVNRRSADARTQLSL